MGRVNHISGVFAQVAVKHRDPRGWFAEVASVSPSCAVYEMGFEGACVRCGFSESDHPPYRRLLLAENVESLTLRGIHYREREPEAKLVFCAAGALVDVVVDLRTREKNPPWMQVVLHPGDSLRVPVGCAHGYLTLRQNTVVGYLVSETYWSDADARGIRWDDPAVGVAWGATPAVISDRDRSWPDWKS